MEVMLPRGGCLEDTGPDSTSNSVHVHLNPSKIPVDTCRSDSSFPTPALSPSGSFTPEQPEPRNLKFSQVGISCEGDNLSSADHADHADHAAWDEFATFSGFFSWATPLELLTMAGQWTCQQPQVEATGPDLWELGLGLPYTTVETYGPNELPSPPYASQYDNHSASRYLSQVHPLVGAQPYDYTGPNLGTAPYNDVGASWYHSRHDAPLPTSIGLNDDGLDDFDRRLLAGDKLPVAHPQSTQRLTLPVAQTALYRRPSLPHNQPGMTTLSQRDGVADNCSPHILARDHRLPVASTTRRLQPSTGTAAMMPLESLQEQLPQDPLPFYPAYHTLDADEAEPPQTLAPGSSYGASSPSAVASLRRQSRSQMASRRPTATSTPPVQEPTVRLAAQEFSMLPFPRSHPTTSHGIPLVSPRQVLPNSHPFQSIFPYDVFNAVQSKCFDTVYGSTDNLVVSAPTGSGKTVILELAICRLLADRGSENFKVVYQAPTKALCSERARDWNKKFGPMNLMCAELTGDTSQAEMRRVGNASIIVTTPEKWDSITRKWDDYKKLLELVELLLIDEVHILKDVRGATLEAVVSRMKSIGNNVRFVALSATVPNSQDIATWLGLNHTNPNLPARLETFGETFRPVKLDRVVKGYSHQGNEHVFDKFLDSKLPTLLADHAKGKPSLVFCFTRKSCESTAAKLAEWWTSFEDTENKPWRSGSSTVVVSAELQELVKCGVAFHHAGVAFEDRQSIERAFICGGLSVICCTSTLAVGVNLPCHTVVLKGTVTYQDGKLQELSDLEVMQMLGRAGRPQYDTSANALILTQTRNVDRYDRMVSGEEILESTLHLNLIEHLNSEIGLRTITDIESAVKWLNGTFLNVRLRQNPDYYNLTDGSSPGQDIDTKLKEICERDVKLLQGAGLVTTDSGFKQTEYGKVMAKYMVLFNTMKLLLELPRGTDMEQLLNTVSRAAELRDLRFKPAERPVFREVNKSPFILYPIQENVTQTWHKVSLLVQLHLGGADYPDTSETQKLRRQLAIEKNIVFERLQRLVRCVIECKGYDCDSVSTKVALELTRSLAASAWEGRPCQLLQIPSIGPVYMRKLVSCNIKTIKELATKNHGELEHLLSRKPPFGKKLSDTLAKFPLLSVDLTIGKAPGQPVDGQERAVPVLATLRCLNANGLPTWGGTHPMATFVAETTSGLLVHWWRGSLRSVPNDAGLALHFTATVDGVEDQIHCQFSCDEIVGTIVSRSLKHNLPSSAFPAKKHIAERPSSTTFNLSEADREEVDDEDMLEAAAMADLLSRPANPQTQPLLMGLATTDDPAAQDMTTHQSQKQSQRVGGESGNEEGDFPLIDELMNVSHSTGKPRSTAATTPSADQANNQNIYRTEDEVARDPVKLPNGKWQCNHACTGGALTKGRKKCSHKCCQEGLDKPRKLKPKLAGAKAASKKRKLEEVNLSSEPEEGSPAGSAKTSVQAKKAKLDRQPTTAAMSIPDTSTQSIATIFKSSLSPSGGHQTKLDDFDMEMEYFDLVDGFDDDFLDLASLCAKAAKETKASDTEACSGLPQTEGESVRHRASSVVVAEKLGPLANAHETTGIGSADFGKFAGTSSGFGFSGAEVGPYSYEETFTPIPTSDTAFRYGGADAMLSGDGLYAEARMEGWFHGSAQALSPSDYKKALDEASRLCDIGSLPAYNDADEDDEMNNNVEPPKHEEEVTVGGSESPAKSRGTGGSVAHKLAESPSPALVSNVKPLEAGLSTANAA